MIIYLKLDKNIGLVIRFNKEMRGEMEMRIFDAHFHIIDFDFPIFENQGYLPPHFVVEDYQKETADLNVLGGAIVSGSWFIPRI